MAVLTTVDGIIARQSNEYEKRLNLDGYFTATKVVAVTTAPGLGVHRYATVEVVPGSLETGVTAYIPLEINFNITNAVPMFIGEMFNMGNLNLATNTFTDGVAMPTRTQGGASNQTWSPVIMEFTNSAGGNATPGNVTVTYTNQSGTGSKSSGSMALGASAPQGSGSFMVLASGDTGAQDITAAVQSGGTTPTGTITFWGFLPIDMISPVAQSIGGATALIPQGIIARLGTSTQLLVWGMNSTAAGRVSGWVNCVGDS